MYRYWKLWRNLDLWRSCKASISNVSISTDSTTEDVPTQRCSATAVSVRPGRSSDSAISNVSISTDSTTEDVPTQRCSAIAVSVRPGRSSDSAISNVSISTNSITEGVSAQVLLCLTRVSGSSDCESQQGKDDL